VLDIWTLTLFVGLLLVGLALVGTGTSRGLGALLLAMGSFGWAYRFTDNGGLFEARLLHVGFGTLFSLGWVAVGLALWKKDHNQLRTMLARRRSQELVRLGNLVHELILASSMSFGRTHSYDRTSNQRRLAGRGRAASSGS
jgi:hypothetical protein